MKKMKNIFNYKKSIWLVCTLFIFVSCEEFLEDELLSDTSIDFLYNTSDGLEAAVVGLYTLNRDFQTTSFSTEILQNKSDLVLGRAGAESLYSRLRWGISVGDFGTRGGYVKYWTQYYKIIDRANAIIQGAENLADIDEAKKNQIIGEAKAFRAHSYFSLYRLFNNIFVTTEPTTPENAFDKPADKSSEAEIFALLKSDLEVAITNLDWTTEEFGRWTQASARHLRAKVAVWEKDWPEAVVQTDAVINNGNYSLEPNTKDVFAGTLSENEVLFATQTKRETVGGERSTFTSWKAIPQYHLTPGAVKSDQNGGSGAGFVMLNNYLRNLLKEDPNDDRDDATYYISYYFFNDPENLPQDDPNTPEDESRQVGDTIDTYDQFSTDASEVRNFYVRINPGFLKYRDEEAEPTDRTHFKNVSIYRLAETYLIGAEAHMMNGNTTKALEYINTVRNRAHAASIDVIDQDAILDERARELAYEGQRWYTLKRMGVLLEYLEDHMGNDDYNQTYATGDPRVLIQSMPFLVNWPIPQAQLDLLGPNYPQNDGY
jgi:hypothetical protein